jgi:hypothetical protein
MASTKPGQMEALKRPPERRDSAMP